MTCQISPGTVVLMLQFPLVLPEADHLLVAVRFHWCCLRLITCWWLSGNDIHGTKFRQYEISRHSCADVTVSTGAALRLITCWLLSGNDIQGTKFRQYEISRHSCADVPVSTGAA
ncbi:hypothetical protein J6590_086513 [Homalodisca vitripennis]|nr:hypothetical protein J6590_086513 [Homalodisca vitripennis]